MIICQQIDIQDTNEKDINKNLFISKNQHIPSVSQEIVISLIKNLSEEFLKEIQKDFDMVDSFFVEEMDKIECLANDAVLMSTKAQEINLERGECGIITQKMKECLNHATLLQNYAILNYEQFRKLVKLHDKSSHYTYDAKRWYKERLVKCSFDKKELFENIEQELACSYANLFNVSQKRALVNLQTENKVQKESKYRGGRTYMLLGVDLMLILILINLQAYFSENKLNVLSQMQEMAIRSNFVIASLLIGIGFSILTMHQYKINYIFILQIPPGVVQTGHIQIMTIAAKQLFIVIVTTCLCYVKIMSQNDTSVPILLRNTLYKIIHFIQPTYWLALPIISLPIFTIKDIVKSKGKESVASYLLTALFNVFTPWRQPIEFHHSLLCSTCVSCREAFRDILNVITCNRIPDYIIVSLENIFNVLRIMQALIRTRQQEKFYPHGFYMIQFALNIIITMNQISYIKNIQKAYWTFVGFRLVDSVYKMYWDVFEEWGLFTGGSSGIKYKYKPIEWTYGKYVRRPTLFPLWQIISYHVIDYISVCIWAFTCFQSLKYITNQFWFTCFYQEMLVVHRIVWMILRMDNQQQTNVEQYVLTNYIPFALDDYDRQNYQTVKQKQKDQEVLEQLSGLWLRFNAGAKKGKEHIIEIANQYQITKSKVANLDIGDVIANLNPEQKSDSYLQNEANQKIEAGEGKQLWSLTKE
ncbi:EXS_family protein [Hexamita inflata]|uniref:EXS family protein n=1 Tax=Hexamita inflata TaxID=28002 RepID=A0AA86TWJ0_9EUKA|nr:EXS family protein [Hexamita inflata]CAI9931016.1 EXS family protein [Hexamita inflata]